jgi:glycosyltransferase involved in cell wall biosynthesis
MKICQIVPSLAEKHGGPSKSVRSLSAALASAGNDVELLTTDPHAPRGGTWQTEGRLQTGIFHRDWPERLCPSADLRRALTVSDAAVVHHHSLWLRTLHYAHQRARRGAKLVVSPRGMMSSWAWHHRSGRKRLSRLLVHPGALAAVNGWHATSVDEEAEIRALGFTAPVCVAPNGVEAPTATDVEAARKRWTEICPTVTERPVALFYSRFHQKKRVLDLIDVWAESAPRDWLLLLVGIPQDYTPETLEAYAAKIGIGDRVAAFAGVGLPPPYPIASLFVLPSHNENFGLVIAEAMAHGVPVLVTDTTPWAAVNAPGYGWCVPWTGYGDALRSATAENQEALRERGVRAREWVLREFAWDRTAGKLAEFYRGLV